MAPDLAAGGGGFEVGFFAELAELEEGSFWFTSRTELIVWALRRHFPQAGSFLEVGCGTGWVLSGIGTAFPDLRLAGSEIFSAGLSFAADRVPRAELMQMDARSIPFEDEFDVIGAFDVLEHIDEDERVLHQMRRALRPGGGLLLTVPQHPFLWSEADETAQHVRRYTAQELRRKALEAGFELLRVTSFVSLLFPLMLASRVAKRRQKDQRVTSELDLSPGINAALAGVMSIERGMIKSGLRFPFGGSLMLVGRALREPAKGK